MSEPLKDILSSDKPIKYDGERMPKFMLDEFPKWMEVKPVQLRTLGVRDTFNLTFKKHSMKFITYTSGDNQLLVTTDDAGKVTTEKNSFVFSGFSNGIHPYHRKQYDWIKKVLESKNFVLNIVEVPTVADMGDSDSVFTDATISLPENFKFATEAMTSPDGNMYFLLQDVEMGRGWAVLFKSTNGVITILSQDHRDTVLDELMQGGFIKSFGIDYLQYSVDSIAVIEKKIQLGYPHPSAGANYLEKQISSYDTLQKIVDQLASCNYETEGGYLVNNVAFLALKRMAEKAVIVLVLLLCTTFCKAQRIDSSIISSGKVTWSIGYTDSVAYAGIGQDGSIEIRIKEGEDSLSVIRMLLRKLQQSNNREGDLWLTVGAGVNFLNEVPDYWRETNNKAWPFYLKQLTKMGFYSAKKKK